ncbi:MAG: preprotein translocase subunit YajC [Planctomycetaceae bacterium]|nr:preprotein translocase subunit YajC [Planctomycetaceae bacterium]
MSSIWMLGAADAPADNQPNVVTMEEAPAGGQQSATQQEGSNLPADNTATNKTTPGSQWTSLLPFILIFVVMYLLLFRGPKKKQQEHQRMVQALKKNDRVRTIGGIYGTVIDVRDDEIVLKIDESTNTKMRVIPTAIAAVLSDKTE